MSECSSTRGANHQRSTSNLIVWWNAPPQGFVKLNFDRSLFQNFAAGGFIICDQASNLRKAGAAPYGDTSILVAEARALRDGLREVIKAGFQFLLIEGDNSTVIQAIKGATHTPWTISLIVSDILHYMQQLTQVFLSHNFREANLAADWVAKLGHKLSTLSIWESPSSPELRVILYDDKMGRALVRRSV